MIAWLVSERSKQYGLLTSSEVEELIAAGIVTAAALVWHRDLGGWEPVDVHFHTALDRIDAAPMQRKIGGQENVSAATRALPKPPLEDLPQTSEKQADPASVFARSVLSAVSLALISSALFYLCLGEHIPLGRGVRYGAWVIGWVTLLWSIVFIVRVLWILGTRRAEATGYSGGGSKATAVLIAGCTLLFGVGAVPISWVRMEILEKRQTFGDHRIERKGNVLTVSGVIGSGFQRDLAKALVSIKKGSAVINLTSSGGLIDEALGAATVIEDHNATVVARTQCDSACGILLMAGETRYAEAGMEIGFHAVSAISGAEFAFVSLATESAGERANAYLLRRGVPQEILDSAKNFHGERMFRVPVAELVEKKVLTGTTIGNAALSIESARLVAKWNRSIRSTGNISDSTEPGRAGRDFETQLNDVIRNLNESLPILVDESTRMDRVERGSGRSIVYRYTLIGMPSATIDGEQARQVVHPYLRKQVCKSGLLDAWFKSGGDAMYVYSGSDGIEVFRVTMRADDCGHLLPNDLKFAPDH